MKALMIEILEYLKRDKMISLLLASTIAVLVILGPVYVLKHTSWGGVATLTSLIMIVSAIKRSKFLDYLSLRIIQRSAGSRRKIALLLILLSSFMAFFFMNDTALLILVPLTLMSLGYDLVVLVLVTIAANVGSSMSAIGNPQNVIIWKIRSIGPLHFTLEMTLLNIPLLLALFIYSRFLIEERSTKPVKDIAIQYNKRVVLVSVAMIPVVIIASMLNLDIIALMFTLITLYVLDKKAIISANIDLIIIFIMMFMIFGSVSNILSNTVSGKLDSTMTYVTSQVLSWIVSNVPATLVLVKVANKWLSLALGVNVAGLGVFTGSLANLITIRLTGMSLRDFHRVAIPYYVIAFIYGFLVVSSFGALGLN